MSLSFWLRDYLYKPLGGSRGGTVKQLQNLMITMILGGLWHGASWHFVLWGAYHGLGLTINHIWRGATKGMATYTRAAASVGGHLLAVICTFLFVLLGWVLFRANDFGQAMTVYQHLVCSPSSHLPQGYIALDFFTSSLTAALIIYSLFQLCRSLWARRHDLAPQSLTALTISRISALLPPQRVLQFTAYASTIVLLLAFAARKSTPFIYFQF